MPNQIGEVLTGQGKSWVLILLASIIALTGKPVDILCHNIDLTTRDRKNSQMFRDTLKLAAPEHAGLPPARHPSGAQRQRWPCPASAA